MSYAVLRSRLAQVLFLALCVAGWLPPAQACTISTPTLIDLGSKTSFEATIPQTNAGSGSSGLACPGLVGLLSSNYVFLSVDALDAYLVKEGENASGGNVIPFEGRLVPGGTPFALGTTGNLAGASLLSLGGVSGEIQFFISLGSAANVAAGTYTGKIGIRWHYAVCSLIGALGACVGTWDRSPGIALSCLLVCVPDVNTMPGAGVPVEITIRLEVTRDCRFDVDDIDFGTAPFVDSFEPVSGALRVTCTKGTTYSVGLSNGNNFNGRRRMASGQHRLEYDVYLPNGERWDNGEFRAQQLTPAQGSAPEDFAYEARIYPDQPTPAVGLYSDVLIVDVEF